MASSTPVEIALRLKNDQLEKDLKKAQRDFAKLKGNVSSDAEAMGFAVGKALRSFILPTAVIAGFQQFAQVINDTVKYVDDLNASADQLGVSFKSFQELQYIALQSDVAVEKLTVQFAKLQSKIGELGTSDGKKFAEVLREIGVNAETLKQSSPEKQFEQIIEALGRIENPAKRAAAMAEIFGRSFKDLNPLVEAGAGHISRLREEINKNGGLISDETMKNMTEFDNTTNELGIRMQAVRAEALGPFVKFLDNEFQTAMDKGIERTKLFTFTLNALKPLNPALFSGLMAYAKQPDTGKSPLIQQTDAEKKALAELQALAKDRETWLNVAFKPSPSASSGSSGASSPFAKAADDAKRLREQFDELRTSQVSAAREAEVLYQAYITGGEEAVELKQTEIDRTRELASLTKGLNQTQIDEIQKYLDKKYEFIDALKEQRRIEKENFDNFQAEMEENARAVAEWEADWEKANREAEAMAEPFANMFEAIISGSQSAEDAVRSLLAKILTAIAQAAILNALGWGSGSFGSTFANLFTGGRSSGGGNVRVINLTGGGITRHQGANGDTTVVIGAAARDIMKGGTPLALALERTYGVRRLGL